MSRKEGTSQMSITRNFELPSVKDLDMRKILSTIAQDKWIAIGCVLFMAMVVAIYVMWRVPMYQADVLLQVQEKQGGLGGNLTQDISRFTITNSNTRVSPIEVQKSLISSRFLLEPVVRKLGLDITIEPRRMPILDKFFFHKEATELQKPFLGWNKYIWGGEQIAVSEWSVQNAKGDAKLKLVAGSADEYQLYSSDGKFLLKGRVGEEVISTNPAFPMKIKISKLVANPGAEFTLIKRNSAIVANELAKTIYIQDVGDRISATYGNSTGIIRMNIVLADPQKAVDILNSIANAAVAEDLVRKNNEVEKIYEFLKTQSVVTKTEWQEAEVKLSQYKAKRNEGKIATSDIEGMGLVQDVEMKGQLYRMILSKLEELRIVKSGIIGDTRILALATLPEKSIESNSVMLLVGALFSGLMMGISIIFIRRGLIRHVEDPYWLEQHTDIANLAIVPHSDEQEKNSRGFKKKARKFMDILAEKYSRDMAIESLRSLRTSLQFILPQAPNNIISIMGVSEGVGKSFISMNFSYLLSDIKRVLLIDGDIRKGHLHDYLKQDRTTGLSDILNGTATIEETITKTQKANLDFLPNGKFPVNPAELLMSDKFKQLLEQVSKQYDLVVIDTPPVLVATDSTVIASQCGTNLLILGAGRHSYKSVEAALKQLSASGVKLQGTIFNNMQSNQHGYAYDYYGLAYQAKPE